MSDMVMKFKLETEYVIVVVRGDVLGFGRELGEKGKFCRSGLCRFQHPIMVQTTEGIRKGWTGFVSGQELRRSDDVDFSKRTYSKPLLPEESGTEVDL